MVENLHLRYAKDHVGRFESEQDALMNDHYEAMDCRNCEAFLQLGVDAFDWLIRADEVIRACEFDKLTEHDVSADSAIEVLFRGWLRPCDFAHLWIDAQLKRGYRPDNLDSFLKCEREARAIVSHLDTDQLSDAMRELQDAALEEHRRGQTAEFV